MKIYAAVFFNGEGNAVTKYVAAKNKAKVKSIMAGKSPIVIAEYKPNNPDMFYDRLTDEEKEQFIQAFISEI